MSAQDFKPSQIPGGNAPKPAERIGEGGSQDSGSKQAGGEAKKSGGMGDKAAKASETAKDIKSIAKASANQGFGKEDAQDVKNALQEKGVKGASGEVARKAVGKGVQAGLDATGVAAPVAAPVGKAVEKGLKKENLKKIALALAVVVAIPLVIVGLLAAIIISAAKNPIASIGKVLTDPKIRDFAIQGAKAIGKQVLSEDTYKKYGYVDKKPGVAVAANITTPPKPGYIEEKILKINLKNAQFQTNSKPSCPYTYTTKEMVGPTGQSTFVIDQIKSDDGAEVKNINDNSIIYYCIFQSMPLYNMLVRTQKAREVNKFSNTILNYADDIDSPNIIGKSYDLIKKYVYDKTYKRITSKASDNPEVAAIETYIKEVRSALEQNKDPDNVVYKFAGNDPNDPKNTIDTLCAFSEGYLSGKNLKKAIYGRLNSGQRSGMKWNTLSSTRDLDKMGNPEIEPTLSQVDGWQSSRAYSQNVYGSQKGVAIDPERIGNTAYGAGYSITLSYLFELREKCSEGRSGGVLGDINALYNGLKLIIADQSNGKFQNINDFGLEQLMIGIIRTGGGASVSGLEQGDQNFNNQSQGFRAISNQYMMRLGGRFLTNKESTQLNTLSENTKRELINKNGIAYRLFGKDNIRSFTNIIAFEAPRTKNDVSRKTKEIIATLSNPIKLIADIHSNFSYIATGKINEAYAASTTGDAYMRLNTIGIPQNDFEGINLIQNSNEIQDLMTYGPPEVKTLLSYFDKCSKSNIPSKNVFARLYEVNYTEIKDMSLDDDDDSESATNIANVKQVGGKLKTSGEINGVLVPFYPSIDDNPGLLGFSDKKELIACEIYLQPRSHETKREYTNDADVARVQKALFGIDKNSFDIRELAKKYRLYLYANGMVDLMVELSNTDKTDSIYASASSSQASNIINSGTIQETAQKILANSNVTYELPKIKDQFTLLASGGNPVPCGTMNPDVLYLILNIAKNHTIQINSLAAGRDCLPKSWHGSGGAVDIGKFDGQALTGKNPPSDALMNLAISLIPEGKQTGFGDCDGHVLPSNGKLVNFFPDECTHVHIQMEFNATR